MLLLYCAFQPKFRTSHVSPIHTVTALRYNSAGAKAKCLFGSDSQIFRVIWCTGIQDLEKKCSDKYPVVGKWLQNMNQNTTTNFLTPCKLLLLNSQWRRNLNSKSYPVQNGDRGNTVVKVLCYKSGGRWFDPSWCQWIFHWHKSFRSHYGPGVDSASNRNEYQEHFLGVKAAGA